MPDSSIPPTDADKGSLPERPEQTKNASAEDTKLSPSGRTAFNFLPDDATARSGWRQRLISFGPRAALWSAYGLAVLLLIVGGILMIVLGGEATQWQGVFVLLLSAAVLLALTLIAWMFVTRGRELAGFRRAQLALRRDEPQSAVEELNTLLASSLAAQRRPLAQFMLGKALDQLGRTEEAISAYRQATTFWPALNNLGSILLAKGDFRRAEAAFKAAIGLRPGEPVLYNQLALVYQRMNEPVLAREVLESCLKESPRSAATKRNLVRLDAREPIQVDEVPLRMLSFSPLE